MTSTDYNDSIDTIEILSVPAEEGTGAKLYSPGSGDPELTPLDNFRVLPPGELTAQDPKERRIARVVAVVGGGLLLMSFVLVGVTLSMSDHIDEMVRKVNGVTSQTTKSTFTFWPSSPDVLVKPMNITNITSYDGG